LKIYYIILDAYKEDCCQIMKVLNIQEEQAGAEQCQAQAQAQLC
jgi:hypothetical protein